MTTQVNLHSHSHGSFLDGQARISEIITRAAACGHEYIALTDHGEVNQHLVAAKAAKVAGLGFIPGMEGYWLSAQKVAEAREAKVRPSPSHICLLAANNKGLANLWALSSMSYTEQYFYYKPISTPELLREYSEGIYASDGCALTEFAEAVWRGHDDTARTIIATLLDIYRERFYMELHTWQYMQPGEDLIKWSGKEITTTAANAKVTELNQAKLRIATELGVPLVVVNDSHHAHPEQWVNKELVWAFNTSSDNDKLQANLEKMAQKADHIMAADELVYWMGKHGIAESVVTEAIANAHHIAQQCRVEITPTLSMPAMAPTERDDLANLIAACEQGFQKYVVDEGLDQERYYARLEQELSLIAEKRFAGYMNMVRDYTTAYRSGGWSQYVKKGAQKEPLLLGPSRGSAGGCLVSYLTGITTVDPIKYGTLFSRFLTPGRKGMPDIDVDVPQSRRPDSLKYLTARFGAEDTCVIGTLSHNGPKAAVKDVGRALGISKLPGGYTDLEAINEHIEEVVRWAKEMASDDVDAAEELTWGELVERKGGALLPYKQKYPELFAKVEDMVGLIRHPGVHAAGVLVSSTPLLGAVPLRRTKNKVITTQLDMNEVEELGGVKLDLLGIRHLDTLSHARRLIYERHGVWIDYDRTGLSVPAGCTNVITFGDAQFNDPVIWDQIDKGHTTGIFQVETSNCTSTAVEFKPRSLKDVADLTSVIRPGVVDAGLLQPYLRRRHGLEPVAYDHPLMTQFLGPGWSTDTYGVLVYQEQFIQCVEEVAGFTPDESDDLRKAVGKKQMDKLVKFKQKFIDGCLANPDYTQNGSWDRKAAVSVAEHIWASIEAAGRYAFNWSHAVGYGMISTWEIWTKHYYPQEFLVALMATDSGNINKYIREARRRNIPILPPDVNLSAEKFTIEGEAIRYGIDTVRGVGPAAARDIQHGRPYISVEDYLQKAGKGADKTSVYNLICIGAFDTLCPRTEALHILERYRAMEGLAPSTLDNPEKLQKALDRRMASGKYDIVVPDFDDPEVVYAIEKELVGTYVTVDPLGRYVPLLDKTALREPTDVATFTRGQCFVIGGQIVAIRPTTTKKGRNPGQDMAHLTVSYNEAEFRIVAFPEAWRRTRDLLKVGAPVACQVKKLDSGCCLEAVERLDLLWRDEGLEIA